MRYFIKFWLWFSKKVDSKIQTETVSECFNLVLTKQEAEDYVNFQNRFIENLKIERKKNKKSNLKILK